LFYSGKFVKTMGMKRLTLLLFFMVLLIARLWAQEPQLYHFKFEVTDRSVLDKLTLLVSIDNVDGKTVFAFANQKEFEAFKALGIAYSLIDDSKATKALTMATTVSEMALWDRYPTYEVYEQMMQGFAASHPDICKLVEIGTLPSGKKLLAVKISDNIDNDWEPEPNLFYTSSMHGDEIAGFVMMLRLIDELLNQYTNGTSPEITKLVNNSVIWINPSANPNGTYNGGNQTVAGAIRYINCDLNRNFPDPDAGDHPDGHPWQDETKFMMAFADSIPISLSANFHSGIEVVNYPWDTWSALCADDLWWKYVAGNYRDSAQANGPIGYFNGKDNGITNGYAWYRITGGRQDYMNYFKHAREVTIEISDAFLYPSSSLNNLWNYNRASFLGYLTEGLNGVQGTITNSHGEAIAGAKVSVLNHDFANSEVYSQPRTGFFARYLKSGNYTFSFSAPGYVDAIFTNITVVDGQQTPLNVMMTQEQPALCISVDSIELQLVETISDSLTILLKNCGNVPLGYTLKIEPDTLPKWLSVNKSGNSVPIGATDTLIVKFTSHSLTPGTYFSQLMIQSNDTVPVPVALKVVPLQTLTLNPNTFHFRITTADSIADGIWMVNRSSEPKNIKASADDRWLVIPDSALNIAPNDSALLSFYMAPGSLQTGFYATRLTIDGDARALLPIEIAVDTLPIVRMLSESGTKEVLIHSVATDTVWVTNIGGGMAHLGVSSNSDWLQPESQDLAVLSGDTAALVLHLEVSELAKGVFSGSVTFTGTQTTENYSLQVFIDTLPELQIANSPIVVAVHQGSLMVDTLFVANSGGGKLSFEISESSPNSWLTLDPKNGMVAATEAQPLLLAFDARNLTLGDYSTTLIVNGTSIAVTLTVLENPKVEFNKESFVASLSPDQFFTDTLVISNLGSSIIHYSLKMEDSVNQTWIQPDKTSGSIPVGGKEPVVLNFSSNGLPIGTYRNHLEISAGTLIRMPLVLKVNPTVK
jgi:hypothetical protein